MLSTVDKEYLMMFDKVEDLLKGDQISKDALINILAEHLYNSEQLKLVLIDVMRATGACDLSYSKEIYNYRRTKALLGL